MDIVHPPDRLPRPLACRFIPHELADQQAGIGIALTSRARLAELTGGAEKLADGGDAVSAEKGELKGFLEREGKFQFSDDLLDTHGVFVGHGGKGAACGIGECFEGGAEAVVAEKGADYGVEEEEKGIEVSP